MANVDPRPQSSAGTKVVDVALFRAAQLPFAVSLLSVLGIVALLFAQGVYDLRFFGAYVTETDTAVVRLLLPNAVYLGLLLIAMLSAFIGYKLINAAGATATVVIPPQDYELLAPLVTDGKSEAIDQYVRLSSLAKFTGTFTQLGLTGLPLATIALTIFFSFLALFNQEQFLDLAKLTLGAFIGSFVQRQVERQAHPNEEPVVGQSEAVPPTSAR